MEYFRVPKVQIAADLAYRMGMIIIQYESAMKGKKDSYEVTLYLSVLQLLMTNCHESYRAMTSSEQKFSEMSKQLIIDNSLFDIRNDMIETTFEDSSLTNDKLINYMRNAVSHPNPIEKIKSDILPTGYTTIEDDSHQINTIVFIDSPEVKNNRLKEYDDRRVSNAIEHYKKYNLTKKEISFRSQKMYHLYQGDKTFTPYFKITFSNHQLRDFVLTLSNFLAQPISEYYDGCTIHRLVA